MGQVFQEAQGQSGEIVPAGEHAVPGPYQRTVERAGPEQLLPQQCRAGRSDLRAPEIPVCHRVGMLAYLVTLRYTTPKLTLKKGGCFLYKCVDKAASPGSAGVVPQQLEGNRNQ